jgi:thiosulfate/3-mercaptopyruvate sulfurtransferase
VPYATLIDSSELASRLEDPQTVIVDARFDLADTGAGERAYRAAHVPGAVYAHLDRDLSGTKTGLNGRHPLPDQGDLVQTLGRLGIDRSVQVVAYDQDTAMWAARVWWLLRWMGHTAVAVLDGGFDAWTAAGLPTRAGVESHRARTFVGTADDSMVVSAADVERRLGTPEQILVDVRAPERYRGEIEPIDPVAGHIPGATNHFYQWNLRQGRFRLPDDLRETFQKIAGNHTDRVVCYCGSGVTACQTLLALEHARLPGARLYAGSWSEWIADTQRPTDPASQPSGDHASRPSGGAHIG